MKKILFIAHSGHGGGAESVLAHLINSTFNDTSKYTNFVIYPKFQGVAFRDMIKSDVYLKSVIYRSNSPSTLKNIICNLYNIPALLYLVVFCFVKRIDLIYINSSVTFIGSVLALLTRTKAVWHIHEQTNRNQKIIPNYIYSAYRKLFSSNRFKLIFVSAFSKRLWEKELVIKMDHATIIYPPVKNVNISDSFEKDRVGFCFGYMGALIKEKNILLLLEAFSEVIKLRVDSQIFVKIAGEGILRDEIFRRVEELGIKEKVEIVGYSNDVDSFFSNIDVLIQPSFNESWGLVALEALAYCKTVIMTKETGLKEILNDGVDCLFIDPLDKNDLVDKMLFLLDHKLVCVNIAKCGNLKFKSFDFNNNFNNKIHLVLLKMKG